MKSQNLNYFLVIAEEGSVTKAAARLYVSQPSLSQYLRRLEKSLGVELFDHSASPLKLTYAGKLYYAHVQEMQQKEENILKEIQDIQLGKRGRIRMGVAIWRGACLLPEVFPEFNRRYPEISLDLTEDKSQVLLKDVLDDKLDFAIVSIAAGANYDKVAVEVIKNEQILLAVPTEHSYVRSMLKHPLAVTDGFPTVPVSIVNELPIIMSKPGQSITVQVKAFLAAHQLEPRVLLETANLTTAINLVASGMGAVFVPAEGAHICKREGRVTYFAIDDPQHLHWDLAVVYKKDAYISRISRLFIDFIKEMIH